MAAKPRVLLLFCGGTITMSKDAQGALQTHHDASLFFQLEPRIRELAELHVEYVDNIDSTNMVPLHWQTLGERIAANYEQYDGFIITMGTNTMAYASSALSFSLQGIGKPVVFTGAQIPAESLNTDARNNLVNAIRVAKMDHAGVFVVFGSKIIVGCRAKKVNESERDAFATFNSRDYGEILIGIKLNAEVSPRHDAPWKIRNGFSDGIACLTLIPGMGIDTLTLLMNGGASGIILRAFGSGDIPYSLLPSLNEARVRQIPIVVTTQCPRGATVMGLNDVGLKALDTGVIQAFDMSMEAMSTKLMWLIAQGVSYSELKNRMHENLAGEVDTTKIHFLLNEELRQRYLRTAEVAQGSLQS